MYLFFKRQFSLNVKIHCQNFIWTFGNNIQGKYVFIINLHVKFERKLNTIVEIRAKFVGLVEKGRFFKYISGEGSPDMVSLVLAIKHDLLLNPVACFVLNYS